MRSQVVEGPNGAPRVRVSFRRSPSDPRDGRYLYTLYRFRNYSEGRQLVAANVFTAPEGTNLLSLTDLEPIPGSSFHAITVTKLFAPEDFVTVNQLNFMTPWWNVAVSGQNGTLADFMSARQRLVSDYSDPSLIYVGTIAGLIEPADIEVNPSSKDVYYSDKRGAADERKILRIGDEGGGATSVLAFTQFQDPGQQGLAIDAQGNLYSENAASDAMFGGRVFRFDGATGAREFVGSINYYSRDLFFANPVAGGAIAMGPGATPGVSPQDLYVVDMLPGQIKRIPVQAPFDAFRRVGQPFAQLPVSGKVLDLQIDDDSNAYLLIADSQPRLPFNDREKGTFHIPPGAPIKQDCPPENPDPFVDPVYLFSGEFYEDVEDIRIKGIGLDFVWTRKYRSKIGPTNSVQGHNWDYSYNIFIERNTNTGGVVVHDGHTRGDEYVRAGTNDLWTMPEFFRELRRNPDGTFTLSFEDKGVWTFHGFTGSSSDGRVKESVDRHGNQLSFFYDGLGRLFRVNDTLGRDIFVAYNAAGFISDITDFTSRTWHYEYYGPGDPDGNPGDLKSCRLPPVTGTPNGNDFPAGKTTTYTYSKGFAEPRLNGNLLTITDPKGQTYLRNTYATNASPGDLNFDRILRQQWGDSGDVIDMVYETVNPTPKNGAAVIKTILNDRNGNVKEYYHNSANQVTLRREFTGRAKANQPTTSTLNRPANKLRAGDPDYFEARFEWNADSLKKREIHPNGNVTEWVYESDLDPAAPARTRGNVREIRHLPGAYAVAGDQTSIVERFEYDTSFGRGCCGYNFVTRHTDGRGGVELKSYDSLGNLTQHIHRIATVVEKFEYDSRGRMTAMVSPDNGSGHRRVDRFVYYGPGDGIQNGYLHRKIVDDGFLGLTTEFEYDARGNVVRLIDQRGRDSTIVYNQLDEKVRTVSREVADGSGVRYTQDNFYDANENLVRTDVINLDENGVVDPVNSHFTTTIEYDILNLPVRRSEEVDPGHFIVTEFQYDRNRNLALSRFGEAAGGGQPRNVLRVQFDERDKVYREIKAEGDAAQHTTEYDYDPNGNPVRLRAGLEGDAREMVEVYDAYDRKVEATDPMGNVTRWHYDANHNPVLIQNFGELADDYAGGTNNVRLYELAMSYDALNRLTNSTTDYFDPLTQAPIGDGLVGSRREYSDCSQVLRVIDDNGQATRTVYDTANRLVQVVDAKSNTLTHIYDANGNEVASISTEQPDVGGPAQVFTRTNTYDNLGRLVRSVNQAGETNRQFFDSRNNLVRTLDPRGNETRFVYDGMNRLIRTIETLTANGTGSGAVAGTLETSQAWDDSSRLKSRTDPNTNTTAYVFDARDRLIATVLPDGTTNRLSLDLFGNIISNRDPNGTVVVSQYDKLERRRARTILAGPGVATNTTFETCSYDGLSRLVAMADDDSVVTRQFDSMGRLSAETQNGRTIAFQYDGVGNRTRTVYPGGLVVSNAYDSLDRMRSVSDSAGASAVFDFVGPARVDRLSYGNNVRLTYQYDAAKRVTRTTHVRDPSGAAITIDDRQNTWDGSFNKTSRADLLSAITHVYAYDSADRLIRSDVTGPQTILYALDPSGNRTTVTGGADAGVYTRLAATPEPADAQVNQYTTTAFDSRRYDTNGNLRASNPGAPGERRYAYDFKNQMVGFEDVSAGTAATYRYDALGRRIERVVSGGASAHVLYFYDGERVVEERTASNTVAATYVYGNALDERLILHRGGQTFYFHGDDLHNTTKLTGSGGAVVEQYEYDDYGLPYIRNGAGTPLAASAVGNPYCFSGREYDPETGFYWYRTRYLDPRAGRFVSRDQIGAWGDPANRGNAYSYADNNPWSRTDPMGRTAAQFAGGVISGTSQGLWDMAAGLGALAMAAPGAAVNAVVDPIGSASRATSGFWDAMTQVASHPDGIGAGYAHLLFPDLMRGAACLSFMSDFEAGKVYGNMAAQFLPDMIGLGQMALSARAAKFSILARMSSGEARMARAAGISGRYATVSDLVRQLRGKTRMGDMVADLLEHGHNGQRVEIRMGDCTQMEGAYRRAMRDLGDPIPIHEKIGNVDAFYHPGEKVIYLKSASDDILRDLMHEGVHAVDNVVKGHSLRDAYGAEMNAYMEEMKFQRARGIKPDYADVYAVDRHIRTGYKATPALGYSNPYMR